MFNTEDHPHLRKNLLTGQWIVVSPHRDKRPWNGQVEKNEEEVSSRHDVNNPLCPGATRTSGKVTPNYTSTYVFENDFPALLEDTPEMERSCDELLQCRPAKGVCRVMCFHPRSDLSLPRMTIEEILVVINEWVKQSAELSKSFAWVQIFENKGNMMGCSNTHPHCQIWACSFLPNEATVEDESQLSYYTKHKRNMLLDYISKEMNKQERVVTENDDWIVVVPYWAMWPYELLVLPKAPVQRFQELTSVQQKSLADVMKVFLIMYDNLFQTSFPYSMGWHGAPSGERCSNDYHHWQLHAHYYPPLLRSATVKKHMVGFELLASKMRDFTPEKAARVLTSLPTVHYKDTKNK